MLLVEAFFDHSISLSILLDRKRIYHYSYVSNLHRTVKVFDSSNIKRQNQYTFDQNRKKECFNLDLRWNQIKGKQRTTEKRQRNDILLFLYRVVCGKHVIEREFHIYGTNQVGKDYF